MEENMEATLLRGRSNEGYQRGVDFSIRRQQSASNWVAVKELNLSYCSGITILITV